jgi:tetratricopeptide (TPR) repeat protein
MLCEFDIIGKTAQGRERLERCLEYAARAQNPLLTGWVQANLFRLRFLDKDFDAARRIAEEMLQSGRENAHWSTVKRALEALAELAFERQDYARVRDYLEQALALCPETETHSRSNTLREIGDAASRQGDQVAAREALLESLALCQTYGHRAHEGWSYHGLAPIAYRQGQKAEAIEWENKALRLFAEIGEEWSVIACLKGLARFTEDTPERAALFWFLYDRFSGERIESFPDDRQEEIDAAFASLRTVLSDEALSAVRKKAASLTLREIVQQELFLQQ